MFRAADTDTDFYKRSPGMVLPSRAAASQIQNPWRSQCITPDSDVHNLLSSRLYGRLRNFTESCLAARGLYHR